ncbi:MAG: UxaA family hydrolase, partial [Eubacteriaceae bacterium]
NDIPYGHKVAVIAINKGELINKYGEEIGIASKDITPGEHVHVHNLDSMRGRGDLERSKQ